ncbi:girdin isoform x5 [Diplodia corticola]|uniref:Girdin isoform x5 n=1 Tax=Diplodia corticola TaxID=236234 RepID=A0A1J9R390_9PEZI|nr:girdin isoform x5 [Diplodia corticola]OJD35894.1 girdin isoform x5 [Diplodia corticola]
MATNAGRPSTPPARAVLHDSPFSDYYSDSPFSAGPQHASKIQSALLNRLSQLAVQVTREEPVEPVAHHVQRALDNLYALFAVPDTQTRQPAGLEDSGLFIEDDADERGSPAAEHVPLPPIEGSIADEELEDVYGTMIRMSMELREGFLEMKDHQTGLVADMTKVQTQNDDLKAQNKSLRSQNDILQAQVAALRSKIESLRTQNQSLRTDLQSDFTELMSLKLQLMAIEVKSALHMGQDGSDVLKQSMERWTEEWHEMDEKFRERREKFSGAVDPNLLGEAHQLAADISAFLNLEDGNLRPKSSRRSRNLPGIHARGSSDPFPVLARIEEVVEKPEIVEKPDEVTVKPEEPAREASHLASVSHANPGPDQLSLANEQQRPSAEQSSPGFLARLWLSGPRQFIISKTLLTDPRKSIWDALSDVTGVGMYDDFYDEYSTAE